MGKWYADAQWNLPVTNDEKRAAGDKKYFDKGLSWQTRYWIDDMFMISALQGQAYRATGDNKYIDLYEKEMQEKGYTESRDRFALSEANVVTKRTPHYLLSTTADYRKGRQGYQQLAWMLTRIERGFPRRTL